MQGILWHPFLFDQDSRKGWEREICGVWQLSELMWACYLASALSVDWPVFICGKTDTNHIITGDDSLSQWTLCLTSRYYTTVYWSEKMVGCAILLVNLPFYNEVNTKWCIMQKYIPLSEHFEFHTIYFVRKSGVSTIAKDEQFEFVVVVIHYPDNTTKWISDKQQLVINM